MVVAPIGTHEMLVFLLQVGSLLAAAFLLGRLATRFRLPAVAGELTAGVLFGPSVLGHAAPALSGWLFPGSPEQTHLLDGVGQLGVLLLVGVTGMYIDLKLVRRKGGAAARVGAGGLVLPLALGVGLGFLVPGSLAGAGTHRVIFALFIGVAICLSAIPVIAKTLLEMGLLHRNIGQLIISAAAVDDIVGWSLLSVISALALGNPRPGTILASIGYLLAVLAGTVVIGRPVVHLALRAANRSSEPGVTVAVIVLLLIGSAAVTQALGLEPILGAFLCGVLIGSSGLLDRHALAPLRTFTMSVLAPVFFATAGLRMDLGTLGRPVVLGAAGLILLVAVLGKFGGAYLGARSGRLDHWHGLALGAGLNARGVVGIVVAIVGLRLGVLTTASYTIVVLVAVLTSLMAPPLLRHAAARIEVTPEERERERAFDGDTAARPG